MHAARETDEDGANAHPVGKGTLHDGSVLRYNLELAVAILREALGLSIGALGELVDRGDLLVGVAAEDFLIEGFSAWPEGRHQRARSITGGIDEVLAQPAFLQSGGDITQVRPLDAERRAVAPTVAGDAPRTALRAQ